MTTLTFLFGMIAGLLLWSGSAGVSHAQMMGEVIRSHNMPQYPPGTQVSEQSEIKTGEGQKIAIRTTQGDVLIAGQNASIQLVKPGFFSHLFGKVYYYISRRQANEVSITTTTSTIGIRGTKFIIDSAGDEELKESVALAEGSLNFTSNDDEYFQLYRQRELTEFELYKREQMAEFAEFKQNMMDEFVAYKASIDLTAGYTLDFDGKKATQRPLAQQVKVEFDEFERFIADN